mmetsp:Transcript_130750/g.226224  ORF Transcript_130750/g.226224 Transcript_130750/m.226224 type:complete len:85 (-) Transcript_130750:75-329(-)
MSCESAAQPSHRNSIKCRQQTSSFCAHTVKHSAIRAVISLEMVTKPRLTPDTHRLPVEGQNGVPSEQWHSEGFQPYGPRHEILV